MKIPESKVRVEMPREDTAFDEALKAGDAAKPVKTKQAASEFPPLGVADILPKPKKNEPPASRMSAGPLKDDYSTLRDAVASVQRLKAAAQQELEIIKKMHADTVRYQHETATRARSEANQLILHARMATQRQLDELIHQASAEIQKMLADIRVLRITAQEELSAQRKFTDAAKLKSLSLSFQEQLNEPLVKPISRSRRQTSSTR
jgi:hypothetical protein